MKFFIIGILAGLALTTLIAFQVATYEIKNSTAEVNNVEGLLIFTDCKPIKEYEYLGTVKSGGTGGLANPQYEGVRNRLIKRIKKEYPKADGAIMNLNYGQADKADAIKFKN